MDTLNKFFSGLVDMLDSEIAAAVAAVEGEGILAKARFRAAVKKAGGELRRLKKALGMEVEKVALTLETVGLLSDSEIVAEFFNLDDDTQADLVVGLEEMEPRGPRLLEMIQGRIDGDAAKAKAEAKAKVDAEEKAEAARIRQYELAHPEVMISAGIPIDDEVALAYISLQPNGHFQHVAELAQLEKDVDGTTMVRSMYSGKAIPTTDAKVLRLCFVCEEAIANRLRKQLGKAERFHHWDETQRWLAARETEAAERETAKTVLVTELSAALADSAAHVDGTTVYDHVSLAMALDRFLAARAEAGQPIEEDWQERTMVRIYDDFVEKARFVFVGKLREQFPTAGSDLDAYIEKAQKVVAEVKAGGASELVRRAFIAQLRCTLTHRDWLVAHPPRQTQQPRGSFDTARPAVRHTGKTAKVKANGEDSEAKKAAKREADRAYREAHKGKGGGGDTRRGQPKPKKGSKGSKAA